LKKLVGVVSTVLVAFSVIYISLGKFWFCLEGYWKNFDFDIGFVGNFGSFFLFLFVSEVESIGIFNSKLG
jgi:hypothetical protein